MLAGATAAGAAPPAAALPASAAASPGSVAGVSAAGLQAAAAHRDSHNVRIHRRTGTEGIGYASIFECLWLPLLIGFATVCCCLFRCEPVFRNRTLFSLIVVGLQVILPAC